MDRISRVCPSIASADAELLVLLFRLLDCEVKNSHFMILLSRPLISLVISDPYFLIFFLYQCVNMNIIGQ